MDTRLEHISIGEAIRQLGIGRTKLYALIHSGDIEAVKLGRRTLVRAQSARDFLDTLPRLGG